MSISDIIPDYSSTPELHFREEETCLDMAPSLIIGLGSMGMAVLRSIAARIPAPLPGRKSFPRLLCITLQDEPEQDDELPPNDGDLPISITRLDLEVARHRGTRPWYDPATQEWSRPDGRLALFQNLNLDHSPLWDTLQDLLQEDKPDVWLVGTTFGASSGMILDISHVIRLICKKQNFTPFLGLMLILPNQNWASSHQAESAATLREIGRWLRHNKPRFYEGYAPESDNYELREHTARGDEDANAVILCEPDPDLFGPQAAETLCKKTSLSLFTLLQTQCWKSNPADLRSFLGRERYTPRTRPDIFVTSFGISAQVIPMQALKQAVRARIARDVLVGRSNSVLRAWRDGEPATSAEEISTFLATCQNQKLIATVASIRSRMDVPTVWPSTEDASEVLIRQLISWLQRYLASGAGLGKCASFLTALRSRLTLLELPALVSSALLPPVDDGIYALEAWRRNLRDVSDWCNRQVFPADRAWHKTRTDPVEQNLLPANQPEKIANLLLSIPNIQKEINSYILPAWIGMNGHLALRLDILPPMWKEANVYHSFTPAEFQSDCLWKTILSVIAALSQDPRYWPSGFDSQDAKQPDQQDVEKTTALTLRYDRGLIPQEVVQYRRVLQVSMDQVWIEQEWLGRASNPIPVKALTPFIGILFRIYKQIPLATLESGIISHGRDQYIAKRRCFASTIHIFSEEQMAAHCEDQAFASLSYKDRRNLRSFELNADTVDLLKEPRLVDALVRAWGNGYLRQRKNPDRTQLSISNQQPLWEEPALVHPLDCLRSMIAKERTNQETIIQALKGHLEPDLNLISRQLASIVEWWKSPDTRDMDWFILAAGILRKRRDHE